MSLYKACWAVYLSPILDNLYLYLFGDLVSILRWIINWDEWELKIAARCIQFQNPQTITVWQVSCWKHGIFSTCLKQNFPQRWIISWQLHQGYWKSELINDCCEEQVNFAGIIEGSLWYGREENQVSGLGWGRGEDVPTLIKSKLYNLENIAQDLCNLRTSLIRERVVWSC